MSAMILKKKELMLGRQMDVACYLTFIEVSVDMGTSALSEVLKYLKVLGKEEIYQHWSRMRWEFRMQLILIR